MSKYGVISGPYFPVFGLNTVIYSVNLRIQFKYRKIRTRNNSIFGHFSCSASKLWLHNNFFTICEPLKMLLCHFCKSDFINFRATFAKTLLKKSLFLWQIFKTFIKLCYLSKFYHVEIFKRIIAALWIFFAFYRKVCFLCLLLSLGISYYYLFIATENCKNVCIFQFWIS